MLRAHRLRRLRATINLASSLVRAVAVRRMRLANSGIRPRLAMWLSSIFPPLIPTRAALLLCTATQ